jgi:hypothetical protein
LVYIAEDYVWKDGRVVKKNDVKRDAYKFTVHGK